MEPNNSPRSLGVFMLHLPAPAVILWLLFLFYIFKSFSFIYLFFEAVSERLNSQNRKHMGWVKCASAESENQHPYVCAHFTLMAVCLCQMLNFSDTKRHTPTHACTHTDQQSTTVNCLTSVLRKGQSPFWRLRRVKLSVWGAANQERLWPFVYARPQGKSLLPAVVMPASPPASQTERSLQGFKHKAANKWL